MLLFLILRGGAEPRPVLSWRRDHRAATPTV
ncbi:hypothetical protein Ae706Ps2_6461c [Pseudonocardia sp. Ae706_Ps2]|nr:hypothetical protein Ae706Ps2_6461c [Pseudonocardia sp. Ae706_Ps2]